MLLIFAFFKVVKNYLFVVKILQILIAISKIFRKCIISNIEIWQICKVKKNKQNFVLQCNFNLQN